MHLVFCMVVLLLMVTDVVARVVSSLGGVLLKATNPRHYEKLVKAYEKTYKESEGKTKFSIMQFKRRLTKGSGSRSTGRGKMMWQREYVEEMEKTCHGNVEANESKTKWNLMTKDLSIKRDNKGPRGALRLRVSTGDYDSSFSEVGEEEEIELEELAVKKPESKDISGARQRLLEGGGTSSFFANGDSDEDSGDEVGKRHGGLRRQMDAANSAGSSILTYTAARHTSVRDLANAVGLNGTPSKRKRDEASDDDGSSDGNDKDKTGKRNKNDKKDTEPSSGKKSKNGKNKGESSGEEEWFDSDVALPRASRQLRKEIDKLRDNLTAQHAEATAAALEFKSCGEMFTVERRVLSNRLHAAHLVLGDASSSVQEIGQKLSDYIKGFGIAKCDGASSATGSATGTSSIARAGPSPGYQNLQALPSLRSNADVLTSGEVPVFGVWCVG